MSKGYTRGVLGLLGITAASLLMIGCATHASGQASVAEHAPKAIVVAAEAKAPVTMDVYEAAFEGFSKCMSAEGSSLVAVTKEGVVWRYSYPVAATDAYNKCYSDFIGIDSQWQLANEYNSETVMKLRQCLTDIGITPGRTVANVWDQVNANKIDPVECTTGVAR